MQRGAYFTAFFFLRGAAMGGKSAFVHAVVTCLALFAASRFTAAVACARADPAARLAALRKLLIKGFFMAAPLVGK